MSIPTYKVKIVGTVSAEWYAPHLGKVFECVAMNNQAFTEPTSEKPDYYVVDGDQVQPMWISNKNAEILEEIK